LLGFLHFTHHKGRISQCIYYTRPHLVRRNAGYILYVYETASHSSRLIPRLVLLVTVPVTVSVNVTIPNPNLYSPAVVSTSRPAAVVPVFCLPCRATQRMPRNMHLHVLCIPIPRPHCAIARPCAPDHRRTPSHTCTHRLTRRSAFSFPFCTNYDGHVVQ
jgi:hypothetical protein